MCKTVLMVIALCIVCASGAFAWCPICALGSHSFSWATVTATRGPYTHELIIDTWHSDYGPGESGTYTYEITTEHTHKYSLSVSAAWEQFGLEAGYEDTTVSKTTASDAVNYSECQCKRRQGYQNYNITEKDSPCSCSLCTTTPTPIVTATLETWASPQIRALSAIHTASQIAGCSE